MKTYYENNLKQSFMILEGEDLEDNFQIQMLQENDIPGLLKTSVKYIDNKTHFYYDISEKISLKSIYEKAKLNREQMKLLVDRVLSVIREIQNYMLEGSGILLDPEYIYYEEGSYYFCYFPCGTREVKKEFHKLTEFFVREVDYKDKEGVHLAYTLHKETMEEHYSIEKIMKNIQGEVVIPKVSYEERIEEQARENNVFAEKKELWGPFRRLWEKTKKRDKWGIWGDL